ncbi:MAG: DNA-3-methyladenine glycosylase [Anaerolineales bacterium]|nr:DNA-3-methyladenine glycosylase [Anaerolineales bacterium]
MTTRFERSFFRRPTLEVARDLLGQRLVRIEQDGSRTAGIISETEAYIGTEDLGCHASAGRTARNESMWGPPGHAYVYFIYGMHWMLNFVTEPEGLPAAVLLRAVIPVEGREHIRSRRAGRRAADWTDGPAKICQAFAIDGTFDGLDLCEASAPLFIEQVKSIADSSVTTSSRVGLNSVEEPWKSLPWRFRLDDDRFAKEAFSK